MVDISTVLAGPNCARYLADFGADVIKVERPDTGDSLRGMAWRDPRDGEGLWWKLVNRNKRNIALDLKSESDRAIFLQLVDEAHVLVENFRPGTLERLNLSPDMLLARNPKLVIVRVSGFGQDGPYASRPGLNQLPNQWLVLPRSVATQMAHQCCLPLRSPTKQLESRRRSQQWLRCILVLVK